MFRPLQALALVSFLLIAGCSDNVTLPSESLGDGSAPLLAENVSLNLLDNGGYALALAGETTEVITGANVAEARADYAALFLEAIAKGYDGM